MKHVVGVDVGGTKVAVGIIREDGKIISEKVVPSNPANEESMYKIVSDSIQSILDNHQETITGIGLGLPGKVNRQEGLAVYQNNLPWRNFPIVARLKESFGLDNIIADNDVSVATYAEWHAHEPRPNETFVYITVSTGIASAAIHDGKPIDGAGFSGELGLQYVKNYQYENQFDRLEHIASGTAIKKAMNGKIDAKQAFDNYHKGDQKAIHVIDQSMKSLADGIYSLACILDPHKIVLGGSIINHQPFLIEQIKRELEHLIIPEQSSLLDRFYKSKYKGNSGIIGAGLKVLHNE